MPAPAIQAMNPFGLWSRPPLPCETGMRPNSPPQITSVLSHKPPRLRSDMPIHGLLTALKRRRFWDSTLVIWGGEFGRMPVSQGNGGRDHNPNGFMAWMAGAGIKGGVSYGETDEIGYKAVKDRVSVHDLHATMLHLLGMDHKRLTYLHNGRRYRLTDVAGEVIDPILV